MKEEIIKEINESQKTIHKLTELAPEIEKATKLIIASLQSGGKLILFGNGGSAADAQHIAAELVGRYNIDRRAIPAIALTTNTSILTSLGNDYDFKCIFERQLDALLKKNDVVLAISTSGNSVNVIQGIKKAKEFGAKVIGFTGKDGGIMADMADICINIESNETCHIQEGHIVIAHIMCGIIEREISEKDSMIF